MDKKKDMHLFGFSKQDLSARNISETFNCCGICELTINSYADFDWLISVINSCKGIIDETWDRYYRGVNNASYDLICSLSVNELEQSESTLINQFYNCSPEMFSRCKSDFEMIALMQHYGLPTRFLDFTRNPLVALWFACQPNSELVDAAVYVVASNTYTSKRMVDLICRFAMLSQDGLNTKGIQEFFTPDELEYYFFQAFGLPCGTHFIDAPLLDKREANQQSVFLIGKSTIKHIESRDDVVNREYLSIDNYFEYLDLIRANKPTGANKFIVGGIECYKALDTSFMLKIIIPQAIKETILRELAYRGITKEFIYPTLENIANEIKQRQIFLHHKYRNGLTKTMFDAEDTNE